MMLKLKIDLRFANMKYALLKLAAVTSLFLNVSCGGTGQDEGSPSTFSQDFSGRAIDGYLARATVFIDTNNDGARNDWEAFAFTDDEGYYSYNPRTMSDYCSADARPQQSQYCLRTNSRYSDIVIRVDGGYDVLTGEPFYGQLSRRIANDDPSQSANTILSPLTSIVTNLSDRADQSAVLAAMGLENEDLDVDYLDVNGTGEVDSQILNTSLKIHKVVSVLADRLSDTYTEIGEEVGTPNDASAFVYTELAQQMLSSGLDLDLTMNDATSLATVLDNAESKLRSVYERKEFVLPEDMGSVSNREQFARVIEVAGSVSELVNTVIDVNRDDVSMAEVVGQSRAIESVVIKAMNEGENDASLDRMLNFFNSEQNSELVASLISSLTDDSADISGLAANDFSAADFDSTEEVSQAAQLPQSALPFAQIGGLQLKVSDLDLGSAPNKLDDSEVEWYFLGAADDVSGSFMACIKYIDDANEDGSLGEGSTRGELVEGFWSLLGATTDSIESYSLLLTITFLETTYQAIMKPAGSEEIGQNAYQRIRFDNNGDVRVWHSENGFSIMGDLPGNDQDCQERLPSRIGL